jgi:hypothetical protein
MITDNALANCEFFENLHGGDTGKRWTEHTSFRQLRFTLIVLRTGQKRLWFSNMAMRTTDENGAQGGN